MILMSTTKSPSSYTLGVFCYFEDSYGDARALSSTPEFQVPKASAPTDLASEESGRDSLSISGASSIALSPNH